MKSLFVATLLMLAFIVQAQERMVLSAYEISREYNENSKTFRNFKPTTQVVVVQDSKITFQGTGLVLNASSVKKDGDIIMFSGIDNEGDIFVSRFYNTAPGIYILEVYYSNQNFALKLFKA